MISACKSRKKDTVFMTNIAYTFKCWEGTLLTTETCDQNYQLRKRNEDETVK